MNMNDNSSLAAGAGIASIFLIVALVVVAVMLLPMIFFQKTGAPEIFILSA
jgi:hypothetical protein